MVQTIDLWNGDHLLVGGRVDGARLRTVLHQRQVRAGSLVVVPVRREDATQMALVKDNEVVQTLPAARADDPLHQRVLPR
jgi:hypothetical protein